jgi:hypothetical protein
MFLNRRRLDLQYLSTQLRLVRLHGLNNIAQDYDPAAQRSSEYNGITILRDASVAESCSMSHSDPALRQIYCMPRFNRIS